jgi:hypothetical protein
MVRDGVEDNFDPAGMCRGDQPVEIHQAAEDRCHVTIVGIYLVEDPLLPPVRVGHAPTPICLVLPHAFTELAVGLLWCLSGRRSPPASGTAASQRPGRNSPPPGLPLLAGDQEQLVLNDALFHAGVVRCAARAIAMASSVVDTAAGGWQKVPVLI